MPSQSEGIFVLYQDTALNKSNMGQRSQRFFSLFLYFSQQVDLQFSAFLIFSSLSFFFFFFFLSFSFSFLPTL